jgi:hypothetical protein
MSNCSSAPSLTVNSGTSCTSPTNGTTVGATQSSTSCAGTADDDVWYSFVATQTSQIITVTPGTMSDAVFQVYSGTCSGLTSLACIDNTLGSSSETTTVTSLTIGSTYYVRVHSYGDYISNVTLNTINNNSTYDLPLGDSYQDFTSISTNLVKGSDFVL